MPAYRAVRESITRGPSPSTLDVDTGPLNGGTAVLVHNQAAYWVSAGRVYYANGVAMSWSPRTLPSPDTISYFEVESAVNRD